MTTQGERIKALAAKHHLTLVALAERSKIDEKALINISNDKLGLGPTRGQRIADALGEDLSDVLLPKAKAETLATVSHRLRSLEGEVRWLGEQLDTAFQALGLEIAPREGLPPAGSGGAVP